MNEEEVIKQRRIGMQQMLVRIIHDENDRAARGGFSFVSTDKLVKWSDMTKEEIDGFIETCANLDPRMLARRAAREYESSEECVHEKETWTYAYWIYNNYGDLFWRKTDIDIIRSLCEELSSYCYKQYCKSLSDYPVSDAFANPEVFKSMMLIYMRAFVKNVRQAVNDGYAWDVIKEMLWYKASYDIFKQVEELVKSVVLDKGKTNSGDE